MINAKDLIEIKALINDFKPEMSDFERLILIPQVFDRVNYIRQIFNEFFLLTNDLDTAFIIDAAVRKVILPEHADLSAPEPIVGVRYLEMVRGLIRSEYLVKIEDLQKRFPKQSLIEGDIPHLIRYFHEVNLLLEGIISVRESMFTLMFKPVVNLRNVATNEVINPPVDTISVILAPFETRMGELVVVATTTISSIKIWSEKIKEQQIKHTDMIADIAQIKVAKQQTLATILNIVFQVVVVIFAIVLAILSQPLGTYIEKKILESSLSKMLLDVESCTTANNDIKSQLDALKIDHKNVLDTCKKTQSRNKQ